MSDLLLFWLQSHEAKMPADYLIFSLWGLLVGLAWTQITRQRLVLPHRDGLSVQLGFLGAVLVAVVVAILIDYTPALAGVGTFIILASSRLVTVMLWAPARRSNGDLVRIHRKNLHQLEVMAARYGMDCPVWVKNAIEYEETEIARLSDAS